MALKPHSSAGRCGRRNPDELRQRVASLVEKLGYGQRVTAARRAAKMNPKALAELASSLERIAGERRKKNPAAGRHNPADGAAAAFGEFHGRPSTEVVEVVEDVHEHEHLASIGELVSLLVLAPGDRSMVEVKGLSKGGRKDQKCWLAENEAKTQLYIRGGDQSVDLGDFDILPPHHETEVLGRVIEVVYFTRKDHLADEGGTADYHHVFGYDPDDWRGKDWNGDLNRIALEECPALIYRVRARKLEFAGGDYTIPPEGITG